MRLGDKLKSTIAAREEAARVEAELKRRREDEKSHRERARIIEWLDSWKRDVCDTITVGKEPKPVRIPRDVSNYSTGPINLPKHPHHDLLRAYEEWAVAEGMELCVVSNHDGGGMESWWEIAVRAR
jgi:hypothetical protein